jgi:hypothetical protein
MITTLLIALAAGLASAMMFASIVSGALISVLLFYLAPLPLMVAGLGWGPLSAAIGGISAATGLGLLFGMPYLIAFVVTVAIPAWWLGHLCLLGRPVTAGTPAVGGKPAVAPVMEWYPVGRILLWIAGFATITTISALLTLGTDSETILGVLKRVLQRAVSGVDVAADTTTNANTGKMIDALATIAPAAAALVAIMTLTLNLWLSAKITATSGRLLRSWPDLKSAALPQMTLVALAIALALSFAGGLVAIFGQIASATLMMAYALTGLAALHTLTLGMKSRVLWLSSAYAVVMVFGWPILALVALGLADAFFGFRQSFLQRRPPTTVS